MNSYYCYFIENKPSSDLIIDTESSIKSLSFSQDSVTISEIRPFDRPNTTIVSFESLYNYLKLKDNKDVLDYLKKICRIKTFTKKSLLKLCNTYPFEIGLHMFNITWRNYEPSRIET